LPDAAEPTGGQSPEDRPEGLFHRVVRSVIAPDVLEDGGHDAPMSPRGRLLFYAVVGILVVGIVVLLLVTASSR
jgi:hypothetical protein